MEQDRRRTIAAAGAVVLLLVIAAALDPDILRVLVGTGVILAVVVLYMRAMARAEEERRARGEPEPPRFLEVTFARYARDKAKREAQRQADVAWYREQQARKRERIEEERREGQQ